MSLADWLKPDSLSVIIGKEPKVYTPSINYVTGKIKGVYILSLKGHMQSTSLNVSNLDASVLLSWHVGFALLEETKGELTRTLRKILSALIFSAPSFIGPSEERADMPK